MPVTENVQLLNLSSRSGVNWLPSITPMKTTIHCLKAYGNFTDQPKIAAIVTKTIDPSIQGRGSFQKANNRPPKVPIDSAKIRGLLLVIAFWMIIYLCFISKGNLGLSSRFGSNI